MKKLSIYVGVLIVFVFNTASFCSRDEDPQFVLQDTSAIVNGMKEGTWRVTFYSDHGNIETDHFTGYEFIFEAGDVLTATNGTNTYTGAWTVTNTKRTDESPANFIDVNILFAAPADFEDISDDWDIVSRTATKIVLTDVADGGTDVDNITFEKI